MINLPWTEIITLLIANAPTVIKTVEEGIAWAATTWAEIKKATDQDERTITKEQLLTQLDRIKATSQRIQDLP